ncbi:Uncharacterised protein [Sebaldella termitidis]|uniref:Uncharacterized protein n=1 Tax=Sebaldella termitidis (strain ATCC 33386 / NCTC 11300) TaxID=526218 RepID=D1AGN7_SEBTE|nr:hypothetical protein [Sebaldella termitidis]ACZ10757.1 hypothetical protein Sterm_3924 [Sebaldella termitidis ATCC 33386]SUI26100.1 Uncharacterised protein [Sebaldella termitidis]
MDKHLEEFLINLKDDKTKEKIRQYMESNPEERLLIESELGFYDSPIHTFPETSKFELPIANDESLKNIYEDHQRHLKSYDDINEQLQISKESREILKEQLAKMEKQIFELTDTNAKLKVQIFEVRKSSNEAKKESNFSKILAILSIIISILIAVIPRILNTR